MPIYVRAGTIVPTDPIRQYTSEPVSEPTTIHIYKGANGTFTLYEDDGSTQQYLHNGGQRTRFTWDDSTSTLTLDQAQSTDITRQTANSKFRVRLHPDGITREVVWSGNQLLVEFP
jgi:alpha-glucosidase/alpha-D-xyloside xylohydrolase